MHIYVMSNLAVNSGSYVLVSVLPLFFLEYICRICLIIDVHNMLMLTLLPSSCDSLERKLKFKIITYISVFDSISEGQ